MLSDAKLRAAQPRPKAYKLTDAHQLYLFVTPKGGKLWRMDYGFDGKQKCLSIAPTPGLPGRSPRETRRRAKTSRRGQRPFGRQAGTYPGEDRIRPHDVRTRCSRMARSEQTAVGQGSCCRSDQNARAGCLSPRMVGGPVAAADLVDTVAWLNPRPPANPMRFTPAGGQARPGTHAACSSGI